MKLFVFLCFALISLNVSAQSDLIRVNAGDDPAKVIPPDRLYRFPQFQDGALYYSYGEHGPVCKMNYNLLHGQLMFINIAGDTLVVADEYRIKYARIGDSYFYHDFPNKYYEILMSDINAILAARVELILLRREMQGNNGYGKTDATTSVVSMKYSVRSPTTNIMNQDVVYKKVTQHILVDKRHIVHRANKSGFLSVFPEHQAQIETFIDEENIRFRKEGDDALKVMKFCADL